MNDVYDQTHGCSGPPEQREFSGGPADDGANSATERATVRLRNIVGKIAVGIVIITIVTMLINHSR